MTVEMLEFRGLKKEPRCFSTGTISLFLRVPPASRRTLEMAGSMKDVHDLYSVD
jgi:hypothetical protein